MAEHDWGIQGLCLRRDGGPDSWSPLAPDPGVPARRTSAAAGLVAVLADSWLDNRRELSRGFGLEDDAPDAELILHAYRRWGRDLGRHLLGDFAFALLDRERGCLLLVRDPIGARPLHYYLDDTRIAFASDLEWLLDRPELPRRLDEAMLAVHLYSTREFLPVQSSRSFWQGIRLLPPGHRLEVDGRSARLAPWWDWAAVAAVRYRRDEDYAEAYRDHLDRALARCTATPARVGAHLSGGADCSMIAILANRALQTRGRTLAAAYTWFAPPSPEQPRGEDLFQAVAHIAETEHLALRSQTVTAERFLAILRQDFTRRSPHMLIYEQTVQEQARADGVGVLLSGWGGDEVATSHHRAVWFDLWAGGHWPTAWQAARTRRRTRALPADLLRWCRHGWLPRLWPGLATPAPEQAYPTLPFADRQYLRTLLDQADFAPMAWPRPETGLRRAMLAGLAHGHLSHRMESWAAAAGPRGLVYRYPLLDRELVAYCLAVPPLQHVLHGEPRSLYRRALAGRLPDTIRRVEKLGEGDRVARLLRTLDAATATLVAEARDQPVPRLFDWLDYPALERLLAQPLPPAQGLGKVRHFAERQAARIALLSPGWSGGRQGG